MPEQGRSGVEVEKPMVVFAGRSNVGKSSILRALTGRRVVVGKKPGSTRWERIIDLGPLLLVDTPGFGHMARMSRRDIDRMKTHVVRQLEAWGERIVLSVLIVDISLFRQLVDRWERRGEIPVDIEFYSFLSEISPDVIVVANKIDKLRKHQREVEVSYLRSRLVAAVPDRRLTLITMSARQGHGIDDLANAMSLSLKRRGLPVPDW